MPHGIQGDGEMSKNMNNKIVKRLTPYAFWFVVGLIAWLATGSPTFYIIGIALAAAQNKRREKSET